MNGVICFSRFPVERYELIQQFPSHEGVEITKYKNKAQQIDYLLLTHTIKQLPSRIKSKIIEQIKNFSTYQEQFISVANKAFIYEQKAMMKICLRVRSYKSKTLQDIISNHKYLYSHEEKIDHMLRLAAMLAMMHTNHHPHGRITLPNITFKKKANQFVFGTPEYTQILKWRLLKQVELTERWKRPSLPDDISCLGKVFIQMWLNAQLPNSASDIEIEQSLKKIDHLALRFLIGKMLKAPFETFKILDVIISLKSLESLQLPQIPSENRQYDNYNFKIQLFKQYSNFIADEEGWEKAQVKRQLTMGQLIFTIINGKDYVRYIPREKTSQLFLDITYQNNKIRKTWKQLTPKIYKFILGSSKTLFRLTNSGLLQIQSQIPSIKQQKIEPARIHQSLPVKSSLSYNNRPQFDKICKIQGQKLRSGCIIAQNFVITSTWELKDLKDNESNLYFQSKLYKNANHRDYDLWIASQEAEMVLPRNYNFCLVCFNLQINLVHFKNYLKLIKNYSEEIIDSKLALQYNETTYYYRLGSRQFQKGQIKFERYFFHIQSDEKNEILSGQPLLLNLPSGACVVVGLFQANNVGILFTDEFYWTLFKMILSCRGEQTMRLFYLSFIIIQCSQYEITEGQLPNLTMRYINYFNRVNNTDRQSLIYRLNQLQSQQHGRQQQKGFYSFILFKEYQSTDYEMSLFYLRKAQQCFSTLFKGKDSFICAFLLSVLGQKLLGVSFDWEQIQYYGMTALEMYRRCAYNPFSHLRANALTKESQTKLTQLIRQLNIQRMSILENLVHVESLKIILKQVIEALRQQEGHQFVLRRQQVENNLKNLQTYRFSIKQFDFKRAIKKTQKSIAICDLNLIQERLDQLLARQRNKDSDEVLQRQIKQLWKSAIAVFISKCTRMDQLQAFQQLTKKYYEDDGYYAVKQTFRQKAAMIQQQMQYS